MKKIYSQKNVIGKAFAFLLVFMLFASGSVNAQKKVFIVTKGDQISSTGATMDSSLIDSLSIRFAVRVWKYSANLLATDSLSLDSAGVIVVTRNVNSGQINAPGAAWWARRPVPIVYLASQAINNARGKLINAPSSIIRSYSSANFAGNRPKDLVIKAYIKDVADPAFKGVTITDGKVNYFKWIYETLNIDSAVFNSINGNYGKLLATAYDPDTASTNKKVIMVRWNPGDSTYRNSGIKVVNYRTYMQTGTDINASFRYFNNFQPQTIQILTNEIKFVCPDIATSVAKKVQSFEPTINVYPNPVADFLTLDIKNTSVSSVSIYNINGMKVRTLNPKDDLSKINLSNLKPGIYIMKIMQGKNSIVKQIIKR
jgi:hypothetical protein